MLKTLNASLVVLSIMLVTMPVSNALAESNDAIEEATSFQFSPPDDGLPDNTTGGASRPAGACLMRQSATQAANITLLAPDSFVGLTTSATPEFLLYAEQTPVKELFVNIKDVQGNQVYQGFQTLPTDTGFFTVTLPEEAPELESGQTYQLSVVPICTTTLRPDDPVLTGYVRRVELAVTDDQASQASVLATAQRYADAGVWYETLVLLEEALSETPDDSRLLNAWDILLTSGGILNNQVDHDAF